MKFISKFFKSDKPIINIIRMNGVIASGSKFPGSSNLSLESLEKQIERAFAGKKIAGVALIINSPGGSPVQSALISERIVELSSKNNIPEGLPSRSFKVGSLVSNVTRLTSIPSSS